MTEQEVIQGVIDIVRNVSAEEELTVETTIDDIKIDSLDCIEVILETEDYFDISIQDDDADKMKSIGDLVKHVVTQVCH